MKNNFDIIIVGNGIASLFCAINLSENYNIAIISDGTIEDTSSYLAQGGIAAVLPQLLQKENDHIYKEKDSLKSHIEDTIKASSGTANREIVEFVVKQAPEIIKDLEKIGIKFSLDNGKHKLHLEAGHSHRRVLNIEDKTGKGILEKLYLFIKQNLKNVSFVEGKFIEILYNKDLKGIRVLLSKKEIKNIYTKHLVIASGGLGSIYQYTTNPNNVDGSGIGIASTVGVVLKDMQFIQFHPTYSKIGKGILISEALRGEGAKLRLQDGSEFMYKYSKQKELAPRDIVSRAIVKEMQINNLETVCLDITHKTSKELKEKFPFIYTYCKQEGLDISKDVIPVSPAAHYLCGGILVDKEARTNIKGIYAIGEASCTGLHGANRLASNSLMEATVFAKSLAKYLNKNIKQIKNNAKEYQLVDNVEKLKIENLQINYEPSLFKYDKIKLQKIMWEKVGILRNKEDLKQALLDLQNLYDEAGIYVKSIIKTAIIVTESALASKSVGTHYLQNTALKDKELGNL